MSCHFDDNYFLSAYRFHRKLARVVAWHNNIVHAGSGESDPGTGRIFFMYLQLCRLSC